MRKLFRSIGVGLCASLILVASLQAAETGSTPSVGLVLGGGGARGAAHIGVLEVLEDLHIPISCIAGTSMGALVAGAYASGLSPARMRKELSEADWGDMFVDRPEFSDVAYRNKQLLRRYIPGSETGVSPDGIRYPPGAVDGEKIKLFFNHLVGAGRSERLIEKLPLTISLVATDIGTGERVVLREGSLTSAMRASMSVPGLLTPVEHDGRKLVDGGLVDNVPIGEARERCNADIVIVVNVGSPLMKSEEVGSLLTVSAQMVNLLTEQNVTRSLATMNPEDIYIKPDLGTITAGDFARNGEAADRGRAAAEKVREQLEKLSVPPARYAAWREPIERRNKPLAKIDEIEVIGLNRVNPAVVARQLTVKPGKEVDVAAIENDVLRMYGDGFYQSVDYKLLTQRERNILHILPVEKGWGPDYLRFALNLEADTSDGSGFTLRGAYHKTMLNTYGAEALLSTEVGTRFRLGGELYQPLDPARHYFAEARILHDRGPTNIYVNDKRVAQYTTTTTTSSLGFGANLGLIGQASLSWVEKNILLEPDIGSPLLPSFDTRYGGWRASMALDQINRLYFASSGWAAKIDYFDSNEANYSRLDIDLTGSVPFGKTVITGRVAHTGSPSGRLPFYDAATMGGFLNMTAYAKGQIVTDTATYAGLRAERILGIYGLGMRGDIRVGLAFEAAKVRNFFTETELRGTGIIDSTALYFGSETVVGPIYLGFGYSSTGASNLFLSVGVP